MGRKEFSRWEVEAGHLRYMRQAGVRALSACGSRYLGQIPDDLGALDRRTNGNQ